MKALLFHCKRYGVKVGKLSNRPKDIHPEKIKKKNQNCKDCIVVFLTVEKDDGSADSAKQISKEIKKMSEEIGHKNVVLLPFAHLSNNLAQSEKVLQTLELIEKSLSEYNVSRSHFGSHKSLLLDVYGHPGNARFREF
jgi:threonyl-tRNA synthetase